MLGWPRRYEPLKKASSSARATIMATSSAGRENATRLSGLYRRFLGP